MSGTNPELDKLDEDLKQATERKNSRVKEFEKHLKEINAEIQKLEIEKKVKIEELEQARISWWLEGRLGLPQVTNRELVEHKIHELYKALDFKLPSYILYTSSPPVFNRFGPTLYHGAAQQPVSTPTGKVNKLRDLCEKLKNPNPDPWAPVHNDGRILDRIPRTGETSAADILASLVPEILDLVPGSDDRVIVLEKPQVVYLTTRNQLHNADGPAIIWRDGYREWWFQGVSATREFIEGKVTLTKIRTEANIERRRVLIERYGSEKFLEDVKATLVDEDEKYGKLWRVPGRTASRLVGAWGERQRQKLPDEMYVQVFNGTPEPDGSVRSFLLSVPNTMTKAHAAVAWTYGKTEKDYRPKVRT